MSCAARPPLTFALAVVGAIGCGLAAGAGRAAETPKAGWSVVAVVDPATGARRCLAVDRVHGRRGGAFLVEVALAATASPEGGATLMLRVPNGADLAAGIGLRRAGGAITRAEWQSCSPETCLATAALTAKQTTDLLAAREISVVYRPLPTSPALEVAVDLAGLKAVWDRVIRCAPETAQP